MVDDTSLDFVFIDADPTESGCAADILAWAPKVKASGWIAGHDWDRPEVSAALDRLLPGWERHDHLCWRIAKAACSAL